jgi:hypothetical protein
MLTVAVPVYCVRAGARFASGSQSNGVGVSAATMT